MPVDASTVLWGLAALVNIACFIAFAYDKFLAKVHWRRIPEATLLCMAALGGAAGGWLAMTLFRHKTRKPKFKLGVPALLALQLVLAAVLYWLYRA